MIHCFVDRDAQALPSWLEAFPQARVVRRQDQATIADGAGILWCRCGPRESLATILGALTISPTQIVVVLADEHGDAIIAEACSLGASGCCNTHAAPEVLRQVALVVENGGLWIGQSLLQRLVGSTSQCPNARPCGGRLGSGPRHAGTRRRRCVPVQWVRVRRPERLRVCASIRRLSFGRKDCVAIMARFL